jgi:hypothetical protein
VNSKRAPRSPRVLLAVGYLNLIAAECETKLLRLSNNPRILSPCGATLSSVGSFAHSE